MTDKDKEPAAENQQSPWYKWPAEWRRDEKFWREVATRAIAGLIVVILGYVGAVLLGYLQKPDFVNNTANVLAILCIILMVFILFTTASLAIRDRKQGKPIRQYVAIAVLGLTIIPLIILDLSFNWFV